MKVVAAAVVLVFLSACWGPLTPEERGIKVDESIHKLYNQDKALLMFERLAEDEFGWDRGDSFLDAVIYWSTETCPYSDEPAVVYNNVCYHGRMWGCSEIYVAAPKSGKTCGSALIHEYAHCVWHQEHYSYDAAHTGPIWDIVAEASQIACDRGW